PLSPWVGGLSSALLPCLRWLPAAWGPRRSSVTQIERQDVRPRKGVLMRVVSLFWKYAVASVAGGVRRAWEKFSPWAAGYALPYAVGALTFCVVAGFHLGKLAV